MAAATRAPARTRDPQIGRRLLAGESWQFLLLLIGHFVVFLLSMSHDEIVAELVKGGHVAAQFAERSELLFGLVLFLLWGALSVRLAGLLRRVRRNTSGRER